MDEKEISKLGVKRTTKPKVSRDKNKTAQTYIALIIMAGAFIGLAFASVWFKLDIPDEIERYLIGGAVLGAGTWAVLTLGESIKGK